MMSFCVSLSSSFCLLPVVLHNVPQALSQIFQQDLRSRVPSSSRRPSLTASNVSNDVTKHVHTHPSLVISVIPILQIFAVPNAELHMWLGYNGKSKLENTSSSECKSSTTGMSYHKPAAFLINCCSGKIRLFCLSVITTFSGLALREL